MTRFISFLIIALLFGACQQKQVHKPTVFIIGDSTVKNGRGDGAGGLWGWGDPIVQYFDSSAISIKNHAMGGTSSRTYRSLGLWQKVLEQLQPGDFVLMQFGHNDNGPINDDFRARGTIPGVGDESEEIDNLLTGEHEVVHSYGWYMRQYIQETRVKGAKPIIITPIPRNIWKEGKIENNLDYSQWVREVAAIEQIDFIDLNAQLAGAMTSLGQENVTGNYFFQRDHTHTTADGAIKAAEIIVEGMKELKTLSLKKYILQNPQIHFPIKKKIYLIGDSTVANGNDSIVGWGRELPTFFDTTRITIINKARGGRSSRSYRYEGLWQEVLDSLKNGDYLLIQFGHNDGGFIDQPKFRGSLKGVSDETQNIVRPDGKEEQVHTFGWYMKQYITEAKAKGVDVFVLSQIPRNEWPKGKVERENDAYAGWAKVAADEAGAFFLDLHNTVAQKYETMGPKSVKNFFPGDHTHTNAEGAHVNAQTVAELIKQERNSGLYGYVELPRK